MASEPTPPSFAAGEDGSLRVPVHGEQLEVRKHVVDTGRGVRVDKRVREVPAEVDEAVWQEHVEVERVPVGRMVGPGESPAPRYEGDTLVVPVLEEVLVVEKRCRIKEELRITRNRSESRHAQTVLLRQEEVAVQRFGGEADIDNV